MSSTTFQYRYEIGDTKIGESIGHVARKAEACLIAEMAAKDNPGVTFIVFDRCAGNRYDPIVAKFVR